ncbi:hypothetical protein KVP10_11635 [Candidimonas humi]|jgi:hypothetical protein|uniref:Uncharacterized protein n=1 Tax=Candidimonas humi TaxID=683355 RepID=A0ABV8P1J8_9BURK|nr:hypothetical protein [Candidimonas humi]MBV6305541.1 hypothetical protein [Candidimonas humi]
MPHPVVPTHPARQRSGSTLLASCGVRVARVAVAVVVMWALTGWAMGWLTL